MRPTVVPVVALKVPPVDGISVRASTGTDAVAPLAPASWIEDSLSPGAFASGTLTSTVPELCAGILTVPAPRLTSRSSGR